MKVYTRTGDQGETSLAGGTRVPKDHPRLEAYGTADELNSQLGMVQAVVPDSGEKARLTKIQNRIFIVCSCLAAENEEFLKEIPGILEEDISDLEQAMDSMMAQIKPVKGFILPAGHQSIALCHIARTTCRRAERRMITLSREVVVDPKLIRYINRLSDYLFVLARKTALDLGIKEVVWTSDFRDKE